MQPQTIFNYELKEELGRGGFGVVHKAVHKLAGRVVAIKLFPENLSGDESFRKKFEREVKILGKVRHPNVVDFVDAGVDNGQHYLVMEYVDGGSLEDRLKGGKVLGVNDALNISRQVLDALAYAHREGVVIDGSRKIVVHGDIHPGNILFDSKGRVKVGDFGLANLVEDLVRRRSYDYSGFSKMGRYAAPERRDGNIETYNDVYSFGLVLAEMLGREPGTHRPMREVNMHVPEGLATIIEKTQHEYTYRYKDAQEMLKALGALEGVPKPGYDKPVFALGGLALAVLLSGFLGWNMFFNQPASTSAPTPVVKLPAISETKTPAPTPVPFQTPTQIPPASTPTSIPKPAIAPQAPIRNLQSIIFRENESIVWHESEYDVQITNATIENFLGKPSLKISPGGFLLKKIVVDKNESLFITARFYDGFERSILGYFILDTGTGYIHPAYMLDADSLNLVIGSTWSGDFNTRKYETPFLYYKGSIGSLAAREEGTIPRSKGWHEIKIGITPDNVAFTLDGKGFCSAYHAGYARTQNLCEGIKPHSVESLKISTQEDTPIRWSDILISTSRQSPQ